MRRYRIPSGPAWRCFRDEGYGAPQPASRGTSRPLPFCPPTSLRSAVNSPGLALHGCGDRRRTSGDRCARSPGGDRRRRDVARSNRLSGRAPAGITAAKGTDDVGRSGSAGQHRGRSTDLLVPALARRAGRAKTGSFRPRGIEAKRRSTTAIVPNRAGSGRAKPARSRKEGRRSKGGNDLAKAARWNPDALGSVTW
jgi:hypothetical protein